jgi:AraC-like DNA-binding protein
MSRDVRFHQFAADLRVMEARGCARRWVLFHDTYTIALMGHARAGFVDWRYRHRSYVVGSDNVVMVMQPGELHATLKQTPSWDFIALQASDALIKSVARDLGWPFPALNVRREAAGASHPAMVRALEGLRARLCTSLYGDVDGFLPTGTCTCQGSLELILDALGDVVRALIEHYAEGAREVVLAPAGASVLRRAKEYLHERYHEPYSLERLAEATGCSRYYLSHLFKKEFGVSPSKYRSRILVAKTSELLARHPEWPLEQIARELGWGTSSRRLASADVMIRNFRAAYGLTPDRFRNALKGSPLQRSWGPVTTATSSALRSSRR